jgi:hypothetical protein
MADQRASAYSARVAHLFIPAPSGRSKCRGCGQPISKGEMRFGESMPNSFGGGEMTLWFHPLCAAYKLPDAVLEGLQENTAAVSDPESLQQAARKCKEHPRLARIGGAEHSKSGQATCRHCQNSIEKGSWRVRIVYYEEGRFTPGGYIHASCSRAYLETDDFVAPILQLTPALSETDRQELSVALSTAHTAGGST